MWRGRQRFFIQAAVETFKNLHSSRQGVGGPDPETTLGLRRRGPESDGEIGQGGREGVRLTPFSDWKHHLRGVPQPGRPARESYEFWSRHLDEKEEEGSDFGHF